jgi:predicted 3-demethylubiquinone-9 3-methyltransferase (glyoxalase superfamily)
MVSLHLKLLFHKQVEEAARFYTDLIKSGRFIKVTRFLKDSNE